MRGRVAVPRLLTFGGRSWSLKRVVLGASLLLAAVISPFKLGVVRGLSMSPSMENGALYLMDRSYFRAKTIARDDIVVFHHDGASYIKRVAAVPGDTIYLVRYRESDQDELVLDWQLSRLRRALTRPPWNRGMRLITSKLGPDEYFVLGDNLAGSVDSRTFGPISTEVIQGRVLFAPPVRPEAPRFALR